MICEVCGCSFKAKPNTRSKCVNCIQLQPYDLVIKQGNCTFQAHSELLSNAQMKRIFRVFGKQSQNK